MKVILLIDNLNSGGAQRQIVNLAIGLKLKSIDVTVMTYTIGEHFQDDLLKNGVTILPFTYRSKLKTFIAVIRGIRRQKPDVLCAYLFVPSLLALLSKFFFWRQKVFVSERFIEHLITDKTKPLCRILYPFATGIIANSKTQTGILKNKYTLIQHKIHYIANSVDTETFYPSQQQDLPDSTLKIIGVGRLTEYKNVKVLIQAIALLCKKFNNQISVNWVGRAYEERGIENSYYKECVDAVETSGLSTIWTWAGKQKNVTDFYRSADLLVHPSYGEGFPNVVCEALATATPVIASNVIDHPSIIKEGYNGYLFEPHDVNQLANKIIEFYALPPEAKAKMRANCRLTATQHFSKDIMINAYVDLFNKHHK